MSYIQKEQDIARAAIAAYKFSDIGYHRDGISIILDLRFHKIISHNSENYTADMVPLTEDVRDFIKDKNLADVLRRYAKASIDYNWTRVENIDDIYFIMAILHTADTAGYPLPRKYWNDTMELLIHRVMDEQLFVRDLQYFFKNNTGVRTELLFNTIREFRPDIDDFVVELKLKMSL